MAEDRFACWVAEGRDWSHSFRSRPASSQLDMACAWGWRPMRHGPR